MIGLGVPEGSITSWAHAVSADGSVVVGLSTTSSSERQAFIWDEAGGMQNLRQLLIDAYGLGDSLVGWILWEATGISADGRTIVGYGLNPLGNAEAWMVRLGEPQVVPIPAALPLFASAVAVFAAIGARHRRRAA